MLQRKQGTKGRYSLSQVSGGLAYYFVSMLPGTQRSGHRVTKNMIHPQIISCLWIFQLVSTILVCSTGHRQTMMWLLPDRLRLLAKGYPIWDAGGWECLFV